MTPSARRQWIIGVFASGFECACGGCRKGSLHVMEDLKRGGVAVVEPEELVDMLENSWLKDDRFTKGDVSLMTKLLPPIVPKLKARLEKLKQFKIPLTLNHGDFATWNLGFKKAERLNADSTEDSKEAMVLFDWERASFRIPFLKCEILANPLWSTNTFLSGASTKVWSARRNAANWLFHLESFSLPIPCCAALREACLATSNL